MHKITTCLRASPKLKRTGWGAREDVQAGNWVAACVTRSSVVVCGCVCLRGGEHEEDDHDDDVAECERQAADPVEHPSNVGAELLALGSAHIVP